MPRIKFSEIKKREFQGLDFQTVRGPGIYHSSGNCFRIILIYIKKMEYTSFRNKSLDLVLCGFADRRSARILHSLSLLLQRGRMEKEKNLLISVPIVCFLSSILLYSYGTIWFWRIVSYVAVFHFIRQQFGFLALYRKKTPLPKFRFYSIKSQFI